MELLKMEFPLNREIMTTVRLVTGGVCSLVGFDLDSAEDLKVCVTESLLLLLHGGSARAQVRFVKAERLQISLTGEGGAAEESFVEEEISVALLRALVDDLSVEKEEGVTRITFGFGTL